VPSLTDDVCARAHFAPPADRQIVRFAGLYAATRTVPRVMTHPADPTTCEAPNVIDRPVRILGGIFSVLVLSVVAVILTALDRADRSRIERTVLETGTRDTSKPWTRTMAARTIDAPRAPRVLAPAHHRAEDTAA
jgi:hypothetical protein